MRTRLVSIFAAAVIVLAGCGGGSGGPAASSAPPSPTAPATFTFSGVALLKSTAVLLQSMINGGQNCRGGSQFADVLPGAQVIITDSNGKTVGLGQLGTSTYIKATSPGERDKGCEMPFSIDGLPMDQDFFGVQVGHEQSVQVRRQDALVPQGVSITFGS
jgi:hypothetical protein